MHFIKKKGLAKAFLKQNKVAKTLLPSCTVFTVTFLGLQKL